MSKLSLNTIAFNLAGAAVLLTVSGYVVLSFFKSGTVDRCSMRFPAGQQFAFDSDDHGTPLTPIELQARAGLREWGILQNAKILAAPDAPGGKVLEVSLAKTENEDRMDENGIGFVWPVTNMQSAESACLTYSVFLPEGFEFKASGYLPGLYGARDVADIDAEQPGEGFAARVSWAQAGDVGLEVRSPSTQGYWQGTKMISRWPLGRWLLIEQEVKLNTPGVDDGILRMWVDGALKVENLGANLRAAPESRLTGVISDIGYARSASDPAAIKLSPFIVQWQ